MRNDNRANRWVLNAAAFVIFLPVLLHPELNFFIKPGYIKPLIEGGHWMGLSFAVVIITLYLTTIILVLWKGRLRLAVLTAFFTFCVLAGSFWVRLERGADLPRQLALFQSVAGIDVYCNDVYLGKTPIWLSEAALHEKVKPWDKPPRQKMVIGENLIEKLKSKRYESELGWFYIPYDFFDQPYEFSSPKSYSYVNAVKSGYWWRFERDGCTGFAKIKDMVWFAHGIRQYFSIWSSPALQYPSIDPYLKHVLHDLARLDYHPSVEWQRHVAGSSGLLFQHLYEAGQHDSRVIRALKTVVHSEFGIHEEMSAQEWEEVLNKVTLSVRQGKSFRTPSLESMAMDMIVQRNTKLIETHFFERLSPSTWEYVALKSQPPALFDRFVYESRNGGQFLVMAGNYSRAEALRLIRRYFRNVNIDQPAENFSDTANHSLRRSEALSVAVQLQNPLVEQELRDFVLNLVKANPNEFERELRMFIDARLKLPLTDGEADSLAEWVAESVPLPEDEKLQFLVRLNSARTHRYVRDIVRRHPSYQEAVLLTLINYPNPALDRFLIDTYQASSGVTAVDAPPNLLRAMVLCDTPRMNAFLEEVWNNNDRNKLYLLSAMKHGEPKHDMNASLEEVWNANDNNEISLLSPIKHDQPNHYPQLHRWTSFISQIEDAATRLAAIPVLDQIDTPESGEILENWVLNSDASVRSKAARALENYRERSRRACELLAGEIKPDDLLTGQTAYVWNGKHYVPEVAASGNR